MGLEYRTDVGAADWLVRAAVPDQQLIFFGPPGFAAYARLRFIPDPVRAGQQEADVEVTEDHPTDLEQVRRALRLLAPFTSTPDECYFCLWEGYSDAPLPPSVRHGPLVELPHRRYALLSGAVEDIGAWARDIGGGSNVAPPAFVWPADRSWCLASDVDPHWAGIGAAREAVDALVRDPSLDVVAADPADAQPHYR